MQPDNCRFEIDDCTSEWVYPPNHFDFIHIRGLFGSIGDWPELYTACFDHLQPGGYVEQVEWSIHNRSADGSLAANSTLAKWSRNALECARRTGKTFEIAENMAGLMREAGFVDVVERRFRWPIGPWSSDAALKEIGRWNLLNWEEGMEGWVMAPYTRVLGVSVLSDEGSRSCRAADMCCAMTVVRRPGAGLAERDSRCAPGPEGACVPRSVRTHHQTSSLGVLLTNANRRLVYARKPQS